MSTMNCITCNPAPDEYAYDDYTRDTVSTVASHDTQTTQDSEVLNTDYRRVTPLFRNIERENWEGVLLFLTTGKWSNSMLASSSAHLRSPAPEIQAKTWVTAYDRKGVAEWSQLPLHAAISYLAPYVVIQKLVELYPKAVHCTDNEGMLPIHLAFGFGATDNILALLLEPFPTSMNEKGLGGRYPHECCELGPNKIRGKVYKIVTDQTIARTRDEVDKDWREFAVQAKKTVGLEGNLDVASKQLTEFILELLKDRKELVTLKKQQQQQQRASPSLQKPSAVGPTPRPPSPRSLGAATQSSNKSANASNNKRVSSKAIAAPKSPKKKEGSSSSKNSRKKFSL